MTKFRLPAIPGELEWKNVPVDWQVEQGNDLAIVAGEHTDWFIDPAGNYARDMVVSVVTRGVSDDCNSAAIEGQEIYLRIARSTPAIAFHYSLHEILFITAPGTLAEPCKGC